MRCNALLLALCIDAPGHAPIRVSEKLELLGG